MKLNLGCGKDIRPDYVNMDIIDYGQEIVRDVLRGIPFSDNTFDEVYTSHFMEHIRTGEDLFFVLGEIWRVLKPGGIFIIRVPHSDTQEAFYPDHKSYWNEKMAEATFGTEFNKLKGGHNFKILEMRRNGIELFIKLEAVKNG